MTSALDDAVGEKFRMLVRLMARLRAPDGCPWDREQSFDTIKPYLLEETYETLDAIDARDWPELTGELGDLMLQVVFFSQMAAEAGLFDVGDALDAINEKLVRRHPHVFGSESARDGEDVRRIWAEVKSSERKEKSGGDRKGLLDGLPRALPALVEAQQISSRAAGAGFDWSSADQVLDKVREEITEFDAARDANSKPEMEGELGDLLFTLVNLARFVKVDPEQALRRTNAKFRQRFSYVEEALRASGRELAESNIEEMETLWQEAKRRESRA